MELTLSFEARAQIQADFEQLATDQAAAAHCFYQRLFELDPSLRQLFGQDMQRQGAKLMKTLGVALQSLAQPDALVPILQRLGQDHSGYGVKPEHYPLVGQALLWMLKQRLGGAFDASRKAQWQQLYHWLAAQMQG